MNTSEHAEITALISRTFDELGGRATKQEVLAHVLLLLPAHLRKYVVEQGLASKIGGFFRSNGSEGLPIAPDIGDGIHVQLELLVVDDFRWVIASQISASKAARARAVQYQQRCLHQHGVLIDLNDPLAGVA